MLNRKLLEKQRVHNCFASYEVHIRHLFYNVKATVSFGNRLTLSISSITAPQDAHKRLLLQVTEWLTALLYQCSREVITQAFFSTGLKK